MTLQITQKRAQCCQRTGSLPFSQRRNLGYNASPLILFAEASMRGFLSALQLLVAFFFTILGCAMAFRSGDGGALLIGSFMAAMGLSFLALLWINLARRPS
jgi:hypothetical protein